MSTHTEVYIGNNLCVGAHSNENGGMYYGKPGDQTGNELNVQNCITGWVNVYRYKG